VLSSGRHLLSLINDILDLSKVETGRMDLEISTFSLTGAVEAGVMMIRERASRHGIEIKTDLAEESATLEADEWKVKQIVFNLLSNAVKFTPDGGRIDILTRCRWQDASCRQEHRGRSSSAHAALTVP
jgi:signal transduction histidine kinase